MKQIIYAAALGFVLAACGKEEVMLKTEILLPDTGSLTSPPAIDFIVLTAQSSDGTAVTCANAETEWTSATDNNVIYYEHISGKVSAQFTKVPAEKNLFVLVNAFSSDTAALPYATGCVPANITAGAVQTLTIPLTLTDGSR